MPKEGQTSASRAKRRATTRLFLSRSMNATQMELTNAEETQAAPSVSSAVKKIIVAVGLSAHSEATASYAARWAEVFAASINLVHVCPLELVDGFGISPELVTALRLQGESAQEALSVLAQRIRECCPNCQATVLAGDPVEEVTSLARDLNADLIVIGSRHPAGFLGRLFAPDQERKMIYRAPCPVLIYQENSLEAGYRRWSLTPVRGVLL
jgi:nucleotide-binding universal stress UspA family protein